MLAHILPVIIHIYRQSYETSNLVLIDILGYLLEGGLFSHPQRLRYTHISHTVACTYDISLVPLNLTLPLTDGFDYYC